MKRRRETAEEWNPDNRDRRNYAALIALAEAARIPFYVVYYKKGKAIEDDDLFHVIHLTRAKPTYHGPRHAVIPSWLFAVRFPHVLDYAGFEA